MDDLTRSVTPPTTDRDGELLHQVIEQKITERAAAAAVAALAEALVEVARPIWQWGDGEGGWVYEQVREAARRRGA